MAAKPLTMVFRHGDRSPQFNAMEPIADAAMEAAGSFLVIVKLEAKYRKPVLYDDLVEIRTTVSGGSRVKIEHEYEVVVVERRGQPADISACVASTTLACVDAHGRLQELPDWLATR